MSSSWNLTPLFTSDIDPAMAKKRAELSKKLTTFINTWKNRDDYLTDPAVFLEALTQYEKLSAQYGTGGDEWYYFYLRSSQDQNDPAIKAAFNKINEFAINNTNDIQFFLVRLAKIKPDQQRKFLDFPGLAPYKHFLERIFAESKYVLSEPEEKILNLKSQPSYGNWVKMVSGFITKEERGGKNFSEISSLLNHQDKKTRDQAAVWFNEIMAKFEDVAEAELNSVLQNKKIDDDLRGYSRPDESRHLSDDVDSAVVDALVEAVSSRNDVAQKYYALKAKLLGLPRLQYHERSVEYGKAEKKYSYEDSVTLVNKVFTDLDPQFAAILKDFHKNGQIDIYPQKGKTSGAFCIHDLKSQPTYILLNHTDKLNDVLTLAHELGHGINNELIRAKQNALNFGTPTSTAEVASTFMEDFVLQELLKGADDELRLTLMMSKLNDDISTIFRQIAAYKFEQELHDEFRKKGYLSKEEIGTIFTKNMEAYMGPAVEQSPGSQNWWIYWSHIRYFFYVYSYASGLLISKSLQNSVKRDPAFIEKVKTFLAAGLSQSPKDIFAAMDVDITQKEFWLKGINEVDSLLKETTALAKKLKKI